MSVALSPIGVCWGIISIVGAVLASVGFIIPYWIEGELLGEQKTSFGSFARCGYPKLTEGGVIEILADCGRYSTFWTIPSEWWRVSTVLVGIGATLSILIALVAIISICISDVINSTSAKVIGYLQLLAGLLVSGGIVAYPLGWGSREVMEACSEASAPYQLGTCRISWSIYLMVAGIVLLVLAFGLSARACRKKKGTYRI